MNNQLRPLSLGELLDRTAELYRENFLLFAGIAAIFAGAMLAIQLLYVRSLALLGYPNVAANWAWGPAIAAVIEALLILMLAGLSIVANNRAVAWVYLEQPASIRAATKSVFPRVTRYLWLMTMVAFRAWAPLAALYVAFFALVFSAMPHGFMSNPAVAQQAGAQNPAAILSMAAGLLILAPLMILAIVYGVWMSLRYSLAVPACVVEDLHAGAALKRSVALSEGSRGRIFVLGLLVSAVRMLLGMLFGFPILFVAFKHPGQPLPLTWMAIEQVGVFFSNTFIGPIYSTGLTLFYYDQRIRKEGFDIEWMMQAAGLTPHAELPSPEHA